MGKDLIIRLSTFLGGVYFVVYFFTPESVLSALSITDAHEKISYGFITVGAVAFAVGIINLFLHHGKKILLRHQGTFYSVVVLVGCASMLSLATIDWVLDISVTAQGRELATLSRFSQAIEKDLAQGTPNVPPLRVRQEALVGALDSALTRINANIRGQSISATEEVRKNLGTVTAVRATLEPESTEQNARLGEELLFLEAAYIRFLRAKKGEAAVVRVYQLLINGFFNPLGAAMFSLLGFYIASAAYRAFRVRGWESGLMLGAAVIVMLGQIPFGVWISSHLPDIRLWLLQWPNGAAFRAISIGASIAGLILSIRIWLSLGTQSRGR